MSDNVKVVIKLALRFSVILLTAQILRRFVVLLIECSIYAWDNYNDSCLSLIFAVLVAVADLIDGKLFGPPSVIDTVFPKLRGQ